MKNCPLLLVLLLDATFIAAEFSSVCIACKGVQAQTVANFFLAFELGLEIVPVINKIELPSADIPAVQRQLQENFDLVPEDALLISARSGMLLKNITNNHSMDSNITPTPSGAMLISLMLLPIGIGLESVLPSVIERIPAPSGTVDQPLR